MGPVEHFLRALALYLCLCSGRAFVALPTGCGAGRAVGASARCSAQSRPIPAVGAALPPRARPASRWLRMSSSSDQEVSTGGTGTGVQTIIKEVIKEMTVTENKEELAKEQWWRVILHNDEIHTFDYVTQSITKIFWVASGALQGEMPRKGGGTLIIAESIAKVVKKLTMKKAYEVTMETHKAGKATVTQAWKSKAESYCLQLQQCGLTASIAPDNKFEGGEEGGGDGDGGGGGGEGPGTA